MSIIIITESILISPHIQGPDKSGSGTRACVLIPWWSDTSQVICVQQNPHKKIQWTVHTSQSQTNTTHQDLMSRKTLKKSLCLKNLC